MAIFLSQSFSQTTLDLEDLNPRSNLLDTITQYPSTNTGTPTNAANPGRPINFFHLDTPLSTYLSRINTRAGGSNPGYLVLSFDKTNLDRTDPLVAGGIPYNPTNDPTTYPATNTGTPTSNAYPGPPSKYGEPYDPINDYLNSTHLTLSQSGDKTIFDLESYSPRDNLADRTTQYQNPLVTGTPTFIANPGAPHPFFHRDTPPKPYLSRVAIRAIDSPLSGTLDITNLDNTLPGVNGGWPYDRLTDPTEYPETSTGVPIPPSNPFGADRYNEPYSNYKKYKNTMADSGSMFFRLGRYGRAAYDIFDVTNLDISKSGANGGVPYDQTKDPTAYPLTANHTSPIRGYFASPGTPAGKFMHSFYPEAPKTYMEFIQPFI